MTSPGLSFGVICRSVASAVCEEDALGQVRPDVCAASSTVTPVIVASPIEPFDSPAIVPPVKSISGLWKTPLSPSVGLVDHDLVEGDRVVLRFPRDGEIRR